MTAPRLELRLDRIHHNTRTLVDRLACRGIGVTGVTKATLGSPEVARELLDAGVHSIGESRLENILAMRRAGLVCPMVLLRSPMISQADGVVAHADVSFNTELDVIAALSRAAQACGRTHDVVLMVELGDLREGIMPDDLDSVVERTVRFPNIRLRGLGTNLACQSGVVPDARNMAELTALVRAVEQRHDLTLDLVSGGNSATLGWALGEAEVGRVNDLRLGESILLGRDPVDRRPIAGLDTDAVSLVAEVIEAKVKPSVATGSIGEAAFGAVTRRADRGASTRVIVAIGRQDIDPDGLTAPDGYEVLGASSDHLVLDAGTRSPQVGSVLRFGLDYSALVRAMTSPFVSRCFLREADH